MIEALEQNLGVVSDACKALKDKGIKICRQTHYRWLESDEAYKLAVDDLSNVSLDFAESTLFKLIKGFHEEEVKLVKVEGKEIPVTVRKYFPPDNTSCIFYLKTKGKKRGYIEKTENEQTHIINPEIDFNKFTDEELRHFEQLMLKASTSGTSEA